MLPLTHADQLALVAELADEVRRLSDRAALAELADSYLLALDEGAFDDARACSIFADDVTVSFPPGDHHGIVGMAEFTRGFMGQWARTHHNAAHYHIEIDGDRATIAWHVVAVHVHRGAPPPPASAAHFFLGGRFDGTAVRTEHGWRLWRLTLRLTWTSGPGIQSVAATMIGIGDAGSIVQRLQRIAAMSRLKWTWLRRTRGRRVARTTNWSAVHRSVTDNRRKG
jgi:hypothetical protein